MRYKTDYEDRAFTDRLNSPSPAIAYVAIAGGPSDPHPHTPVAQVVPDRKDARFLAVRFRAGCKTTTLRLSAN